MAPGDPLSAKGSIYHMLYNIMMEHYFEDERNKANDMAERLLEMPDLPIIIRARCNMVLATRPDGFAIQHAEEAIRVLNEDARAATAADPGEFPQDHFDQAKELLADVEKAVAEGWGTEEDVDGGDGEGGNKQGGGGEGGEERGEEGDFTSKLVGVSAADRLAIKEALEMDLGRGKTRKTQGLATPGVSRTATGQSQSSLTRQASGVSRKSSGQPYWPTPRKESGGVAGTSVAGTTAQGTEQVAETEEQAEEEQGEHEDDEDDDGDVDMHGT